MTAPEQLGLFLTTLRVEEYTPAGMSQANLWVLTGPLSYLSATGHQIIVPKGFITDLASIPRPLRGIFNVNGKSRAPAVLHDYLYCSQQLKGRKEADGLFLEAMVARGMDPVTRNLMYVAVRSFGWIYYNKRQAGNGLSIEDFVPPGYFSDVSAR